MAKRILVVDDEQEIVLLLTARLKMNGFEVITAQDGLEGLEKARTTNPDLIILDVMMPKMDGYHVCRLLKFDEKYKTIPIIMLTSRGQQSDKETGKEVSADVYFTKPFDGDALINEVKRLFEEKANKK